MNTNLFGESYVDPMPSEQLPLFHEPVTPDVRIPGTTATDRRIKRKFRNTPTSMLSGVTCSKVDLSGNKLSTNDLL